MRLYEIKPLLENVSSATATAPAHKGDFVTYKASARNATHVYYGIVEVPKNSDINDEYVALEVEELARKSFLGGGLRKGPEAEARGAKQLVDEAGSADRVEIELITSHTKQWEARNERNEYREGDPASITGPSHWPVVDDDETTDADRDKLQLLRDLNKITAREASSEKYAHLSGYNFNTIMQLKKSLDKAGQAQLRYDFDHMLHHPFKAKYFPGN